MRNRQFNFKQIRLVLMCLFIFIGILNLKADTYKKNLLCFNCHSKSIIDLPDSLGKMSKHVMKPSSIIDEKQYYSSNHKAFFCSSCHDKQYEKYPHARDLKNIPFKDCIDCHNDNKSYIKIQFDQINLDFSRSVHNVNVKKFTCSKCHDPHKFIRNAGINTDVKKTIIYDNGICLNCHSNKNLFKEYSNAPVREMAVIHDWLPQQELHFKNVRCVECHSKQTGKTVVAHLILPKSKAVRKCNECHSSSPELLQALYKFNSKNGAEKNGFTNSELLEDAFIIGANKNPLLNLISIGFFALAFIVIFFHAVLRFFTYKKH